MSTSTFRRISRAAAASTSSGDEERRGGVGLRLARARDEQAAEHGQRAGEVAAEVQRVRRERGAPVAPRARGARRASGSGRPRSRSRRRRTRTRRDRRRARVRRRGAASARYDDDEAATRRGSPPPRAPTGARPCRDRTGGRGPRAARRRRRRRTSAARRRGRSPSAAASEMRPRLPVAKPVPSLSAMSAAAATTETSAVRRCGLMPGRLRSQAELSTSGRDGSRRRAGQG